MQFNEEKGEDEICNSCGENCNEDCKHISQEFMTVIHLEDYLENKLNQFCSEMKLEPVNASKKVIEIKRYEKTDLLECRINLAPEQIERLFRKSDSYNYRGEGSILKLRKGYQSKEGVIRLAPAAKVDEQHYAYRAEGCQISEIPTVQLLHLLPNFSGIQSLYFIGEVLNVSGWLGGYNFQWAWSSGWVAGQVV